MRRALVTTALVEQATPLLGLDEKPLMTEPSVRSAVQRVSRDLHDMFVARGYSTSGWLIEQPPTGENGIEFSIGQTVGEDGRPSGEWFVGGQMTIRRD